MLRNCTTGKWKMFRSRWVMTIVIGSNTLFKQWTTYGPYNVYLHSLSFSWTLMIVSAVYSWRLTFPALVYLVLFTTCRFSLYFLTPNNNMWLMLVICRLSNEVSKATYNWRVLVRYLTFLKFLHLPEQLTGWVCVSCDTWCSHSGNLLSWQSSWLRHHTVRWSLSLSVAQYR